MEEDSSFWQDLSAEFFINNQEEAENLVSILDQAKIDRFGMHLAFQAEYQKVEFMSEFKEQTEGFDRDKRASKKGFHTFLRKPDNFPNQYIMELKRYDLSSKMFMHLFNEEVVRIESDNNYKIFADRNKLRIFMKQNCELNVLSKNKLFQMRDQLNVLHSFDQGLIAKISNSQKLIRQLQERNVTAWFKMLRNKQTGFFFSKKLTLTQIEGAVQEIAKFSISLFNFRSRILSKAENTSTFDLLAASIAEEVVNLQEEYEIDVEFNSFRHCLVVHKKHDCFGREVEQLLQQMISKLVVFSIKSKETRIFINSLRKEIKNMPFLQQRMNNSRNEVFLAVKIDELSESGEINLKLLENFLKFFKIVVDSSLQIKVFFHYIQQSKRQQEIQRVIAIAQNNNLHLKNEGFVQNDKVKGIWTLRDVSEAVLPKRQRQLIEFMKCLIVGEKSSNPKEMQSMIDSFFQENSVQSLSLSKEGIELEERTKYHEKGRMEWLKEPFSVKKMRTIEEGHIPYILGSRRRDLEKLFENNNRGAKFKIWSLELNDKVSWPAQVEQVPIFIKNGFDGIKFNEKFQSLSPASLKPKESGLVVFLTKSLSLDFLPVLQLERIC